MHPFHTFNPNIGESPIAVIDLFIIILQFYFAAMYFPNKKEACLNIHLQ